MDNKAILNWEIAGILFIIIFGSILHFTYEWSRNNPIVGFFSAVNESVWEHMKMGFMAALFFALIEYFGFGHKSANFIAAKTLSFYVITLAIPILFYTYTSILGTHNLLIDIFIFCFSVVLAQWASYKVLTSEPLLQAGQFISVISLIIIITAYSVFTYFPPKLPLFFDPQSGDYGV